jgi:hypothetical protein
MKAVSSSVATVSIRAIRSARVRGGVKLKAKSRASKLLMPSYMVTVMAIARLHAEMS